MKALVTQEIAVRHSIREDMGREYLTFDVPAGWDDVKKVSNKVLLYDNRRFVFTGWNSDTNKCYFYRMLDGSTKTARIIK